MVKQTGFLYKEKPEDYLTGSSALVFKEINPQGNWVPFLPEEEIQYKEYTFDTVSCTAFSALNILESWLNFYIAQKLIPEQYIQWLKDNGYFKNGNINLSDRFTAIMSGTTSVGNYFQNVWDSIRKDGVLPEQDFPFGGNSWQEYHDVKNISDAMKTKAKESLNIFEAAYEFTTTNKDALINSLKQCPLHIAIPLPGTHAVEMVDSSNYFDTYPPFIKPTNEIAYAMKVLITIKPSKEKPMYKYFKESEVVGLKPELVKLLDKARGIAGVPFKITSGYRSVAQNASVGGVNDSSHELGLAVDLAVSDGIVGAKIMIACVQVGFKRFGFYNDKHLHIDIATDKPTPCYWIK